MKTEINKAQNLSERKRDVATQQLLDCMSHWSLEWRNKPDGTAKEAVSRILNSALAYIEELESALKPFAGAAERMATEWSAWEDHESHWSGGYAGLNVGDLRAAHAAIKDSDKFVRLGISAARVVANCESAGDEG